MHISDVYMRHILVLASFMMVDVFVDWNMDGVGLGNWDLNLLLNLNGVWLLDLIGDGLFDRVRHRLLHYLGDNLKQDKNKLNSEKNR